MASACDAIVAERFDAGDPEGVAGLFAEATYGGEGGPVREGSEAVLAALRGAVVLHDGLPHTKHVVTNVTVDLDEAAGTAAARSYFTVLQARPDLPLQPIIAGRYHDRFERVDGRWRFADRQIIPDLIGDLSRHLRDAARLA